MKTPINEGLAQSDLDMAGFDLLNWSGGGGGTGHGIPVGGTAGQSLTKIDSTDYNAHWSTVTGGAGSDPMITVNVRDAPYNATGDGVTDDSAAIQSAINATYAAGGGVVFFPKGIYLCNGAFDATTNSVLKIPYSPISFVSANNPVTVELRGEVAQTTGNDPKGSVIKCTKTGTGTAPSILAAYSYVGRALPGDFTTKLSYVQVVLRNMGFLLPSNPTMDGVRLETAVMAVVEDVQIWAPATSAPTHGTVGLWMPSTQNFATNYCNRVWVVGFDTGMVASSEHFRAPQANFENCNLAVEFLSGGELGWGNFMIYQCIAAIKFTSIDATATRNPVMLNMQIEYVSSGWQTRGAYDIIDTSNSGSGELRYYIWGGTSSSPVLVNGGTNLRLIDANTAGTIHYIGTDARLTAITGGVKLEVRNAGTGVWVEATRYTNP